MRTGRVPPQTLGAVGQPVERAPVGECEPFEARRIPQGTERALFYAYRHTARRVCPCHGHEMSDLERQQRQQRQLAMATIAAERAAAAKGGVA